MLTRECKWGLERCGHWRMKNGARIYRWPLRKLNRDMNSSALGCSQRDSSRERNMFASRTNIHLQGPSSILNLWCNNRHADA